MEDKEQLRQKFEACMHRGDTYTERDFQMWCAGHGQGFAEGFAARGAWSRGDYIPVCEPTPQEKIHD